MSLADAHIHLFTHGFDGRRGRPACGGGLELYEALRRQHDIAKALVVGYEGAVIHAANNDYIAKLSREHAWMVPTAYLAPWPPPDPRALEALATRGFDGLVLYVQNPDVARLVSSWPAQALDIVARSFRVVSFNAAAPAIGQLVGPIRRLEPCTVLFSHLGLPGRFTVPPTRQAVRQRLNDLLQLSVMEHVAVKLSGYYAVGEPLDPTSQPYATPIVEALFEHFGATRLLWGSDYPSSLGWVPFRDAVDIALPIGLSPTERDRIMGGNLLRLLEAPM